jgi:hypothetical protein
MIESRLVSIRLAVYVPIAPFQGGHLDAGLAEMGAPVNAVFDDLLWWTGTLKKVRASKSQSVDYFPSWAMKARAAGPGGASLR